MSSPTKSSTLELPTGEHVFYRSAGSANLPTILLLHGFPTSSHQYRHLIPALSTTHHVLAPDLPGFGFTTVPASYAYTFDSLASTISSFLSLVLPQDKKFSVYIFDYGSPVGMRLATSLLPGRVSAIVSQNGNAYDEGLTPFWDLIRKLWADPSSAQIRANLAKALLTDAATLWQYTTATPAAKLGQLEPEAWTLDSALLARPGQEKIQLDLFADYGTNPPLYPKWQRWVRESKVPVLAIWGKGDPIFGAAGAEAFKRDAADCEVELLDAGHFVLETEGAYMAERIVKFLGDRGL